MGRAKAAVFPEPVWAIPRTSSPARMRGMQCCWTGVGLVIPRAAQVVAAHSGRPRSEKEVLGLELELGLGFMSFWCLV